MNMFCKHCNRADLTTDDFYFNQKTQRYSAKCRKCTIQARLRNKEAINAYRRKYYRQNAEKLKKQSKDFYHNNEVYRERRLKQFAERHASKMQGKRFNSAANRLAPILQEPLDPTQYEGLLDQLKDAISKRGQD